MFLPELLVRVYSDDQGAVIAEDMEYHSALVFEKVGHNQWIASRDKQPVANININRLQSTVYWYQKNRWAIMPRTINLSFEQLSYKLDQRRKLRWTRDGLNMEFVDGSLVFNTRAQIQHLVKKRDSKVLNGYIKIFNTEYGEETIVSGFIAMVLWCKPDIIAKVRENIAFQSNKLNKGIWKSIVKCIA